MRIGLISLIVLLILPASYSAVTLTIEQARKGGSNSLWEKSSPIIRLLIKSTSQSNNELVLTVVEIRFQKKN